MAEYRYLAKPDPEWVDFPNNLPPGTKIEDMKKDHLPITPQDGLEIYEFDVKARDGHPICLRSYRKTQNVSGPKLPLFIYMHGGGYVTGGLETDDSTCRAIAQKLDVRVLSVEYRLAPEHRFPVGFQDSFDVVRWVASEEGQGKLHVDLQKGFVLGGTSAGANFTSGIAHYARDEGLTPKLTGVVFLAGSFCHPDARPAKYADRILSVDEVTDAPGLTRKSIDYFAALYGAPPLDKRLSNLLFDSHADIAKKAYFAVCGWDPRRDEALLLEQVLKEEGMGTKLDVYPGLPHGFWTTCPELPESKRWLDKLLEGLNFVFDDQA
ncbi:hypothetical protein NLG97_g5012 [Lecanicillium saksenae]|uniref:Uncharacterized protein n=1 Tax=Lecanicillium saksenae TaxID=468837 RepID=A0ACC1QUU8_9HYPO|nr:hypothetical protein NLG97_g5012 [Lecanicillium saksenae]